MLRKLMIAATASLVLVVAASPAAASRYTGSHGAAHHRTGGDRYTDPLDGIHYVDPLEGGQYTNPLGHDHYTDPLGRGGHKHGKTVSSAGLNKYLRYCGAESRTRHSGRTATPFSLCVSAMAKLANGKARSAVK